MQLLKSNQIKSSTNMGNFEDLIKAYRLRCVLKYVLKTLTLAAYVTFCQEMKKVIAQPNFGM